MDNIYKEDGQLLLNGPLTLGGYNGLLKLKENGPAFENGRIKAGWIMEPNYYLGEPDYQQPKIITYSKCLESWGFNNDEFEAGNKVRRNFINVDWNGLTLIENLSVPNKRVNKNLPDLISWAFMIEPFESRNELADNIGLRHNVLRLVSDNILNFQEVIQGNIFNWTANSMQNITACGIELNG